MSTKKSQQTRSRSNELRIYVLKKVFFKKERELQHQLIQENFLAVVRKFTTGIHPLIDQITDEVGEEILEEPKPNQRGLKRKLEEIGAQPKRFKE